MRYGSLFTGIGGMDLGLDRAGMECAWQVEVDPFCRKVLTKHWPDVPKLEDVRDVGKHNLEPVDLIAGGFPCQPISHNGRGRAQGDDRWLWPELARIIDEIRPSFALLENVSAITGRGLGDVLGDLASLGYDAEWVCLRASDFGAPHRRERFFAVAYPQRFGREEGPRVFGSISPEDLRVPTEWRGVPHRNADGRVRLTPQSEVFRVGDGFPTELDLSRLKGLGNAVVPQVAEWIGRRIMEADALFQPPNCPSNRPILGPAKGDKAVSPCPPSAPPRNRT